MHIGSADQKWPRLNNRNAAWFCSKALRAKLLLRRPCRGCQTRRHLRTYYQRVTSNRGLIPSCRRHGKIFAMLEVNHLPLPSPATWRPTCPLHSEVLAIFHGAILLQSAHQNVYPNHPREASAKDRTLRFAEVGKGPRLCGWRIMLGTRAFLIPSRGVALYLSSRVAYE
jgi:hypothetical protein